MQQAAAWKILNSFAEKGQVESTLKVFECLKERNLIQVSNVTLGPVVKAYVTKLVHSYCSFTVAAKY